MRHYVPPSWLKRTGHEIEIIEKFGSKVIAVGINTEGCTDEEAFAFQKTYQEKLNLPVLLPIQEGVDKLLPVLKEMRELKLQKRNK